MDVVITQARDLITEVTTYVINKKLITPGNMILQSTCTGACTFPEKRNHPWYYNPQEQN